MITLIYLTIAINYSFSFIYKKSFINASSQGGGVHFSCNLYFGDIFLCVKPGPRQYIIYIKPFIMAQRHRGASLKSMNTCKKTGESIPPPTWSEFVFSDGSGELKCLVPHVTFLFLCCWIVQESNEDQLPFDTVLINFCLSSQGCSRDKVCVLRFLTFNQGLEHIH